MKPGACVVVVPARRASTRLPDKLLLDESGRPLLAHVLERCLASQLSDGVIAAVDDPALAAVAEAVGVEAVLTDPALPSGTDRVCAALAGRPEPTFVVNVQGDEALIEPDAIDALIGRLTACDEPVVTLAAPFPSDLSPDDPSAVKVVLDGAGRALYFSRAHIPNTRTVGHIPPMLHLGVYGFRRDTLERFASMEPAPIELAEGLEQLRLLSAGIPIGVVLRDSAFRGIDTRADYDAFLQHFRKNA